MTRRSAPVEKNFSSALATTTTRTPVVLNVILQGRSDLPEHRPVDGVDGRPPVLQPPHTLLDTRLQEFVGHSCPLFMSL